MTDRRSIIGLRLPLPAVVPSVDRPSTQLQVQLSCLAVADAALDGKGIVGAVAMPVDEAGCHHMPRRVDGVRAADRLIGNGGDFAVFDADVATGVEPRFRIHHPPVVDDDIEWGAVGRHERVLSLCLMEGTRVRPNDGILIPRPLSSRGLHQKVCCTDG